MTVKRIVGSDRFIGVNTEQPTDGATTVRPGATFYDYETGILYITYDNGANWVAKSTDLMGTVGIDRTTTNANKVVVKSITAGTNVVGKVFLVDSGGSASLDKDEDTAHTDADSGIPVLVVRKDTAVSLAGADGDYTMLLVDSTGRLHTRGYEFTINGVNFNGYAKIKTLMLPSDCASGAFVTFHHYNAGGTEVDYQVPSDPAKVFIAFQALVYESYATGIGVVGETAAANTTPFTKEVLFLSNGTASPSMENCYGSFAAGKYVTASSISYIFKSGSALYGVEVDA